MSTTQSFEITPQVLLRAYSIGMFPMADSADDPTLFWVDPEERGIFPLDGLIVSRSLAKLVRSDRYEVRVDQDFDAVIEGCAGGGAWRDGELVGGLYGVQMGGAFFGESMFHTARDASKVALVHLVARLRTAGASLLDTQFVTPHLQSLGAVEIPRAEYHRRLDEALGCAADFYVWPKDESVSGARALDALR